MNSIKTNSTESLQTPSARFMPYRDPEVEGLSCHEKMVWHPSGLEVPVKELTFEDLVEKMKTQTSAPVKPYLMRHLRLYPCAYCKLTWLHTVFAGTETPGPTHPVHHSAYDSSGASSRSLLVFISGVCSTKGHSTGPGGIGVFFHHDSPLNTSEGIASTALKCPSIINFSTLKLDLVAAERALEIVKTRIVPERNRAVQQAADYLRWSDEEVRAIARFRLIIATASLCLVNTICPRSYHTAAVNLRRGSVEKDAFDDVSRVKVQVEELSLMGIQVVWYHVQREESKCADELARGALSIVEEEGSDKSDRDRRMVSDS